MPMTPLKTIKHASDLICDLIVSENTREQGKKELRDLLTKTVRQAEANEVEVSALKVANSSLKQEVISLKHLLKSDPDDLRDFEIDDLK